MRLRIDTEGEARIITLESHTESATLSDLIEYANGFPPELGSSIWVDDREYLVDTPLNELVLLEGTRVSRTPREAPKPQPGWTLTEIRLDGCGAPTSLPIGSECLIGRSPKSTVQVHSDSASWSHATVTAREDGLFLRDAGSTNGTRALGRLIGAEGQLITEDCAIRVGSSFLMARKDLHEESAPRPGSLHNVTVAGLVPFNRPPRSRAPEPPRAVQVPVRKTVSKASPFSLAMVVGPIILALVMILIMRDIRFALFSALSPILAVFTWIEQKRRKRKEKKEAEEDFIKGLTSLRADLDTQASKERAARSWICPDIDLVRRRAALPSTSLWQRRPSDEEFLRLSAGIGDVPWTPPVDTHGAGRIDDAVTDILAEARIGDCPVDIDLADAGVVGIAGDHEAAVDLARSLLLQAAVHCGPADLTIGIFHDQGREADWDWATWLPHCRDADGASDARWYSSDRKASETMFRSMRDSVDAFPTPALLLLLDSDVLLEGRDAPARTLLGHGRGAKPDPNRPGRKVSAIVIAASVHHLPASCTAVIELQEGPSATLTWPGRRESVKEFTPMGAGVSASRTCAEDLARFEDPELAVVGAGLPSLVRLNPLLKLSQVTGEEILVLWNSHDVSTPVGMGEDSSFDLDLVRDGPHGLVGGTTGSGKSEFLRTLVAGLAARHSPERLTFILIDFKGGAAFKTCERLPHTIGTVSNLDEQLANRALRALEAEMDYRQRLFAEAGEGVDNLEAYLATNPEHPLPRLLLVIDEFAMLAKEHPDVLSALVSVAAVGRTLGIHMILATQRPAGVVNEDILANTNLRVALRVQSREDSSSVIGVPDAAAISRRQRGRAYVKLGQDDITAIQTALVTGPVEAEATQAVTASGGVGVLEATVRNLEKSAEAQTDLDLLIDAIVDANTKAGIAPPRPVWPEPLGERVHLENFPRAESGEAVPSVGAFDGDHLLFAISDDPDYQRQIPAGWTLSDGNLLLAGIPGYGTTTALASIALTAAANRSPEDLDLLILDMGANELRPLSQLPHCTGYTGTGAGADERRVRFIRFLKTELERRRADPEGHRLMIVLVDGLGALREEYKDSDGLALLDEFYRVYQDGPDVGIHFVVATSRIKVVPMQVAEVTEQKMLFQLAARYDYTFGGLKADDAPPPVPGRAVVSQNALQTHIATPGVSLAEAVDHLVRTRWAGAAAKQDVVGSLPSSVRVSDLDAVGTIDMDEWRLPVGVAEEDLRPAFIESYEGEHILVAGPPRSGKSTVLLALAEAFRAARGVEEAGQVWAVCSRRSPLAGANLDRVVTDETDLPAMLAALRLRTGPLLLLVDDAERIADSDGGLNALVTDAPANVRIAAAGRTDDIRGLYTHWTKTLRRSRCGVLLQPNVDMDSDVLSARIPRKAPVAMSTGRGYLCLNGTASLVQTATPSEGVGA